VGAKASGEILTAQPGDVNSLEEPRKAAPRPLAIEGAGAKFTQPFPAQSVSVFRLREKR
jgi:hypothetical protein